MLDDFDGILRLQQAIEDKIRAASPSRVLAAQAAASEQLRELLQGLSRPRDKGDMLAGFVYEQDAGKVETLFGWGKPVFYGRFKETGHRTVLGFTRQKTSSTKKAYAVSASAAHKRKNTARAPAQPHLRPTFEANRQAILQTMIDTLERG